MSVVWRRTLRCSFQSVLLDGKTATGEHCLIFCCLNPDARSWGIFVKVLTASHGREASPASAPRERRGQSAQQERVLEREFSRRKPQHEIEIVQREIFRRHPLRGHFGEGGVQK